MENNVSQRLLGKLQGKVDEAQLRSIASGIKRQDLTDESKLRQLIRTLAAVSGKTITPEKEDQLVVLIREQSIHPQNLHSLVKQYK